MTPCRAFFVGGGTAGHVYPCLAVAAALRELLPEASFYYGAEEEGAENELVDWSQFTRFPLRAARTPLQRSAYPSFIWQNAQGILQARRTLRAIRPDFIFAAGGFLSAPVLAATAYGRLKIPYYLHEQNAVSGRVTRLFAPGARAIFTSFSETSGLSEWSSKIHFLGNPVRPEFFQTERHSARESCGLAPEDKLLLVLGGSLGARFFNQLMTALPSSPLWSELKTRFPELKIKLVSGLVNSRTFDPREILDPAITTSSFLKTSEWLPAADLVLARAGASILMELAACGRPAILVPFPAAVSDHQRANAALFAAEGAAVVREESELNPEEFLKLLMELLGDKERLAQLSQAVQKEAKADAARQIAEAILEDLKNGR